MKTVDLENLKDLDNSLDLFTESPAPDTELLADGLYPPLPIAGGTLIWGYGILSAAEEAGHKTLICREYPWMDHGSMLELALRLENRPGKYSWEEKMKIYAYIIEKNLTKTFSGLGILLEGREDGSLLQRYAEFNALDPVLKRMVTENIIDHKIAREVAVLPSEVIRLFDEGFEAWRLSFSQRRIALIRFYEISRRDRMGDQEMIALLKRLLEEKNPVDTLDRMRYPNLLAMEESFEGFKKQFLAGSGIDLKAPEYFEGDSFRVSFSFNKKNMEKKLSILKKLQEHSDELFTLL